MGEVFLFFGYRDDGDSVTLAGRCIECFASEQGLEPGPIIRLPSGKPVVSGGEIFFSVSHSGSMWLCAVHTKPVGVDIERIKARNFSAVARRMFLPQEQQYINGDINRFYELWCAKEAWVKLEGTGIARGFSGFCAVLGGEALTRAGDAVRFKPDFGPDYCACMWACGAENVRLLPVPGEDV